MAKGMILAEYVNQLGELEDRRASLYLVERQDRARLLGDRPGLDRPRQPPAQGRQGDPQRAL